MKKFLNKLWGKLKYKLTPDSDIAKDFVEECLDFKHNEHLMTFLRKEFKNYKSMTDPDYKKEFIPNLQEPKMVTSCLAAVVSLCPKKQVAIDMLMGMYDVAEEYEEHAKNHKCVDKGHKNHTPGNRSVH
jgi:hypothetical protein